MSARVEAAAKALTENMARAHAERMAAKALAAADAVMFDEAAVERAAMRLAHPFTWEKLAPSEQNRYRTQIRASIAALKGDDAVAG